MSEDQVNKNPDAGCQIGAAAPLVEPPKATTAVPVVATTGTGVAVPADMVADLQQFAGAGLAQDASDFATPFLQILQNLSPQVKAGNPKQIKGLTAGMIFNTVSNEVFDGQAGIVVVPCFFDTNFVEWKPRESGGGLVAVHDRKTGERLEAQSQRDEKNHSILPNGNEIRRTAQYFVLLVGSNGKATPAIISMSSTQLKVSRKWNTAIADATITVDGQVYPAPSFAKKYKLTTWLETKGKDDWFSWKVEDLGFLGSNEVALFKKAKEFYVSVSSGKVKAADPSHETESAAPDAGEPENLI